MNGCPKAFILQVVAAVLLATFGGQTPAQAEPMSYQATLKSTLEHRQALRARRHARVMREQNQVAQFQAQMLRQQMYQAFLFESQRTGRWSSCTRCGSVVSPYATVGQNCPFCGARWSYARSRGQPQ